MYRHILIPVEHSDADRTILAHVQDLARLTKAKLLLLHVADGWAAQLRAAGAAWSERSKTTRVLDQLCGDVRSSGFEVDCKLAMGDPASEILKVADEAGVDLIAMATHGHRFIADMIERHRRSRRISPRCRS
jgi:nucleotide-binding universal stress UspA family protein